MTNRLTLFFLSAATLLLVVSCKRGGKSGLLVPKDAGIVFHINGASLSSKLSWAEISQTKWFEDALKEKDANPIALSVLKNPESSGVDIKGDIVLFMKKQGRGGLIVVEGGIKDASAFETFVKQVNKDGAVVKDGDYSHMEVKNEGLVTWNKNMFVIQNNAPMPDMSQAFNRTSSYDSYKFPLDSLKVFAKNALNLKSDDNLDTDSRFASLLKDNGDMHIWVNSGAMYGNTFGGIMSMMRISALIEGNISAAALNFDDGKISVKGKQYYGDEMAKLVSKYQPKSVSADVYNRIPSQNIVGVMGYNYPPEGLKEFLKVIGVDGVVNGYLGKAGYSIDEFVKANKGDMVVAFYDFDIKTEERTIDIPGQEPIKHSSSKPDFKLLFATSVNDKAAFDKLVTVAAEQLKGDLGKLPEISYKLDNNWFVASNSAEGVDQFLAGKSGKNPVADKIGGYPCGFYLDLQKILRTAEKAVTDSSGKQGISTSYNMWQDVIATGGEYKDKGSTFNFEINLVDKKTNSLKQLNSYFDALYKIDKARRDKWNMDDEVRVDTVAPAPVR